MNNLPSSGPITAAVGPDQIHKKRNRNKSKKKTIKEKYSKEEDNLRRRPTPRRSATGYRASTST